MKDVLLWIWQLPQNVAGFLISRTCRKRTKDNVVFFTRNNFYRSGVCLGNYIILDYDCYRAFDFEQTIKHECGHQKQSKMLGIFYLLIIGLPSLCGNLWDRTFHKKWFYFKRKQWYYNQPWEKWADKLGGVERT